MYDYMKNEIILIDEKYIENKIYLIRGKQVMLDSDFMFQLTEREFKDLKCKKFTSSWGGVRKMPYAFTEQGIYMLMTVLRGDLAIKQSKALIRIFKRMINYL